jgi:hypothetical protein
VAWTTFIKFPIKWLNIWSKKEIGFYVGNMEQGNHNECVENENEWFH